MKAHFHLATACGICQDKKAAWTKRGFLDAVRLLLNEKNALFESLTNKLSDYPKLRNLLYALLFMGKSIPYNPLEPSTEIAEILGFVKNIDGNVVVANRIFESLLYNLFLAEETGRRYFLLYLKHSSSAPQSRIPPAGIFSDCYCGTLPAPLPVPASETGKGAGFSLYESNV